MRQLISRNPRSSSRWILEAAFILIPLLVLCGVWLPVVSHFRVSRRVVTEDMTEAARHSPEDGVLEEIAALFPLSISPKWEGDQQLITAAEKILRGRVEVPGFPAVDIGIPLDARDLEKPDSSLLLAGLTVPKILLDAYSVTRRDEYLIAAKDMILAWARFEKTRLLPRGLLWNDHAIAARVQVLTEFWRLYRQHPAFEIYVARELLQWISRSGEMLARPSHFTFWSNHGIMQNLGLWNVALAFPTVPGTEEYELLALERSRGQLEFLFSEEGVFLEHSAGYQEFDHSLISSAFRYLTLLGLDIPREWIDKYEQAELVYATLRRPDGSLPLFGDTSLEMEAPGPLLTEVNGKGRSQGLHHRSNWAPHSSSSLYPIAGYSVWWDGLLDWPRTRNLSQTTVVWSHFVGHAHKHADELSVQLWARGQVWWTNVGYWPYGVDGRKGAEAWTGSNAPHLRDEPAKSERQSRLLGYAWRDDLAALDLERAGPGDFLVRRQLLLIKPDLWIVIDFVSGTESDRSTTLWTTSHTVNLIDLDESGGFLLRGQSGTDVLSAFFFGSEGVTVDRRREGLSPFGGWEVVKYKVQPTASIVVEQPANGSWVVAVWRLRDFDGLEVAESEPPLMTHWVGVDNWAISVPMSSSSLDVQREGRNIRVGPSLGGTSTEAQLMIPPSAIDEKAAIGRAYQVAAGQYPRFLLYWSYRRKVTLALVALLLLQETVFLFLRRLEVRHYLGIRVLNSLCWIGGGAWLLMRYLV